MKDQRQPLGRDEDSGPAGTPEPSTVGRRRNRLRGYPARGTDLSQRTAQPRAAAPDSPAGADQPEPGAGAPAPPVTGPQRKETP